MTGSASKRVILIRHATAVPRSPMLKDFERSLTDEGIDESRRMARRVRKLFETPDRFISSPANRALETSHLFAREWGYPRQKVLLWEQLYEADDENVFWPLLTSLDDGLRTVALFGHDPTFSRFAARLTPGFTGEIPKAGVLLVEFGLRRWKDLEAGTGRRVYFTFPGAKKAARIRVKRGIGAMRRAVERCVNPKLALLPSSAARAWESGFERTLRALGRRWRAALKKDGFNDAAAALPRRKRGK